MTDTADLNALAPRIFEVAQSLRHIGGHLKEDGFSRTGENLLNIARSCDEISEEILSALATAATPPSEKVCEYCDRKHPKGWLPNWASSECTPPPATPSAGPVTDEVFKRATEARWESFNARTDCEQAREFAAWSWVDKLCDALLGKSQGL